MTNDEIKRLLKYHKEDLRNNNLDNIFKDCGYLISNVTDLRNFLTKQGIDPLEYVTKIPYAYFYRDQQDTLNLSSYVNIKSIKEDAFADCKIDTLILPPTIKELKSQAFSDVFINTLDLPEGIKEIPYACFYRSRISELKIPNSVQDINDCAFEEAEIDALYLPDNLKSICSDAFRNYKHPRIFYKGKRYATRKGALQALENNGVEIII